MLLRSALVGNFTTADDKRVITMHLQAIHAAAVEAGKLEYQRIMAIRAENLRVFAIQQMQQQASLCQPSLWY